MFKGIYRREIVLAAALVAGAGFCIGIYFHGSMAPVKGLKISAPDFASISQHLNQTATVQNLDRISSSSFMAAMGLNISPPITVATAAEEVKNPDKPEVPLSASPTVPIVQAPTTVDLDKTGYKLRGIVLEDGRSAAFVYVPKEKRVMVIRENASGTIKLIEAGLRSVRLQTPDGIGILTLENARQAPGNVISPGSSILQGTGTNPAGQTGTQGAIKQPSTRQQPGQPEGLARPDPDAGPNAIANNINNGQLRLSQERGKFSVEVREIPESLKGYDIRPGDKIIGTDAGDFSKPQDIAQNLGSIGERPRNLRIQRGGRVISIKAPAPPATPPGTTEKPDSPPPDTTNQANPSSQLSK